MGMADVATVLYEKHLKFDAKAPDWPDRDRFILSAGHGSMLLYSLLHLTGYEDMTLEQVKNFRQWGAITAGHPEYGHAKGIETTTGPLGQGIANAVGFALAEEIQRARYGRKVVDHYTYVIAGDGCLMEGISQEAITVAGHLKLSKLVVFWDDNHITIDGDTNLATSDDQQKRFEAAGWHVQSVDGHDPEAVDKAIQQAKASDKPSMIACRTTIGFGAPTMAGTHAVHGAPLGDEEIKATREGLGWSHPPFEIPADVMDAWRNAGAVGAEARQAWEQRLAAHPAKAEFERTTKGTLPAGWEKVVTDFKKKASEEAKTDATRKSSQAVLEVLAPAIPELIGGSADLTGSNNTKAKAQEPISAGNFGGAYIHYGVREHGMGAIMNGLGLHGGFVPYGGTFLVFADYMRPAIRMAALMEQRAVYVLTHDSIGLGEDGPTHQPVEHVASLRAMPNVLVFRPADSVETAECWQLAIGHESGPSCLALTRQGVPVVRTEHTDDNLSAKGAYVLAEASGDRKATLLATGSEVSLALEARAALEKDGIPTAVVSMPCQELFDAQPAEYRSRVLGASDGVRVAIEAAVPFGWDRYIGTDGGFVGMTGFGASGPAGELYKHFGITADAAVQAVKARV